MKVQKHHYSSYLISVHFERGFMPDSLHGKIEICENFLSDLGDLARENGQRLHATYSIVSSINGCHAHFGVSWLPLSVGYLKTAKNGHKRIARKAVIELLEAHYFLVDNPLEAIKRITHDKKFVTDYIILQPKENQNTEFSGFYKHSIIEPAHSKEKSQSYKLSVFFDSFGKHLKTPHITNILSVFYITLSILLMIIFILLSLF